MKSFFVVFAICAVFFLHGCGVSLLDSRYSLELPDIPQRWAALLGKPYWRIEWLNSEGRIEVMTLRGEENRGISLPQGCASAVLAMPFWPDRGLRPGIFRPAGAIFPFDASGKSLILSWRGGVDAKLYWELVKAYNGADEETASPEEASESLPAETAPNERAVVPRVPWNFDWPRFRLLFEDQSLNAEVRADPWLADWQSIAAKIVLSGFDKRRLVPEPRINLTIPLPHNARGGPWTGTSPFAAPLVFETEPVFPARSTADTWVSREGILRCNTETWIFIENEEY
ncbi:MAG: hypothetical protein LBG95_08905 [Treponema sp.]|jgi:hypothetical protein|nr:hypothetical protein [Treponema sp.]